MRARSFTLWTTAALMGCAPVIADQDKDGGTAASTAVEGNDNDASEAVPDEADPSDDTGAADDTEVEAAEPPMLEWVGPQDGTNAGGQLLTLRGERLAAADSVLICGLEGHIEDSEGDRIRVWTPAIDTEGSCDIEVYTPDGSALLIDAFTYWTDATGQAVAFVSWATVEYANPDHWSGPVVDEVRAKAAIVDPTDLALSDLYVDTVREGCVRTDGDAREDGWAELGGQESGAATLRVDDADHGLPFNGELGIYANALDIGTASTAPLGLKVDEAGVWPAIEVDTAAALPDVFEVTVPDVHGYAPPMVSARDFEVRWTGQSADYVGVDLWDLQSDRRVRCLFEDDGAHSIPESLLRDFGATWTQLLLTRYSVDAVEVPFNRGEVRVQAGTGISGAVYLTP